MQSSTKEEGVAIGMSPALVIPLQACAEPQQKRLAEVLAMAQVQDSVHELPMDQSVVEEGDMGLRRWQGIAQMETTPTEVMNPQGLLHLRMQGGALGQACQWGVQLKGTEPL